MKIILLFILSFILAQLSFTQNLTSAWSYHELGYNKIINSQYKEAIDLYDKALKLDSTNTLYLNNRAFAKLRNNDISGFDNDFDKFKKYLFKDSFYFYLLAFKYLNPFNVNKTKTLEYINKSIELDSLNFKYYNLRGIIFFNENNLNNALSDFDKSILLDKNNYEAKFYKGIIKYIMNDYEFACSEFSQIEVYNKIKNFKELKKMICGYKNGNIEQSKHELLNLNKGKISIFKNTFELLEESPPVYLKGERALLEFIQKNVKYPSIELDKNIRGKPYISFIVNEKGSVENVSLSISCGNDNIDEEARRVVSEIPSLWIPGKKGGIPVKVQYELPISLKLNDVDYDFEFSKSNMFYADKLNFIGKQYMVKNNFDEAYNYF